MTCTIANALTIVSMCLRSRPDLKVEKIYYPVCYRRKVNGQTFRLIGTNGFGIALVWLAKRSPSAIKAS